MNRSFRIHLDPEPATGGGGTLVAAPPLQGASPAEVPAQGAPAEGPTGSPGHEPGQQASPGPGGATPGEGSGEPQGGTPQGGEPHVLDSAPKARGTPEYIDWFNSLSYADRASVERELNEGYIPERFREPKPEEPKPGETLKDGEKPAEQGGTPGEKPAEGDVGAFTQDDFSAMEKSNPAWKARIEAMQGVIDAYSEYNTDELRAGVETINKDPHIQARLAEIRNGGPLAMPEQASQQFDSAKYIDESEKAHIDSLTDEGRQAFVNAMRKAFDHGHEIAKTAGRHQAYAAQVKEQRISKFSRELDQLVAENDNLKPANPDTPFSHKDHPMNGYVRWAVEKLGDEWLDENGHKAGYAAYLAVSGELDNAFSETERRTRTKFIENLTAAERDVARTARGGSPGSSTSVGQGRTWNGIDLDQYANDLNYRQQVFNKADQPTRRSLERFIVLGDIPKN